MWILKSHPQVLVKHIWDDLVFRSMNYSELADKYEMSERNVRRKLDLYTPPEIIPTPADVIAMDVTYFGRSWGILTVINVHNGKPLYCEATNGYETVWDYEKAIRKLHKYNVYPKIAIADGKFETVVYSWKLRNETWLQERVVQKMGSGAIHID